MYKLRILAFTFDNHISSWELPAFREALATAVSQEHQWFHQHTTAAAAVIQSVGSSTYPLIQYKCFYDQPVIVCLGYAIEQAKALFERANWLIQIHDRTEPLRLRKAVEHEYTLQVVDHPFHYRIYHWLGLSDEQFQTYQNLDSIVDKTLFLEETLTDNVQQMAQGIGWALSLPIRLRIREMLPIKQVSYQGHKLIALNFIFQSNTFLPDFIGLGRGCGQGFGVVRPYRIR